MSDDKKKFLIIGLALVAVVAAAFSFKSSGGLGDEKPVIVGSLEDWENGGAANAKPGSQPAAQTPNPDRPNDLTGD